MNRLRLLWAVLTQTWVEQRCVLCGEAWYSSANHPEPRTARLCQVCDEQEFDVWLREFEARTARQKGAA